MLKKLFLIAAALSLCFSICSCTKNQQNDNSESSGENENIQNTQDISKSDHEIKSDYINLTPSGEHDVSILIVNAGKADSMIFKIDGKFYLVDTGTSASVPAVLTGLAYMDCEYIDGMFITHSHNDHVGGADEIISVFPVEKYYTSAISADMLKLSAGATKNNIEHIKLEPGECAELSDGVYFEVFGPYRYNPLDDNNNSLVMKLRVNGVSMLLTGDMLFDEEKTLLSKDFDLECDILKVGHHGRKDATSTSFIEAVSADTAIISTNSDEEPDSPHKSILKEFKKMETEVYVTQDYDVGILINIEKDGKYTIENARIKNSPDAKLKISEVSKEKQSITIKNKGNDTVDLSGYFIFSDRGNEIFIFPKGSSIPDGGEITVVCEGASADNSKEDIFVWNHQRVWSSNKDDNALLYDRYGNILDTAESE